MGKYEMDTIYNMYMLFLNSNVPSGVRKYPGLEHFLINDNLFRNFLHSKFVDINESIRILQEIKYVPTLHSYISKS